MTQRKRELFLRDCVLLLFVLIAPLAGADFEWHLAQGFPRPAVPAGNPVTDAKVELGRYLFYDKRMSMNGKQACASCHRQELAFTDGKAQAEAQPARHRDVSHLSALQLRSHRQ